MIISDYITSIYCIKENIDWETFFIFTEKCGYPTIVDDDMKIIYMTASVLSGVVGRSLVEDKIWVDNIPTRVRHNLHNRLWDIYNDKERGKKADAIIGLVFEK